ncbi:triple functional domain protein-like [Fundulus diaphanus]
MVSDPDGGPLGRMYERRVFLFEQLVIFSEPLDKKKGFSLLGFLYKNSIKVSCLGLEESVDGDPCKFILTSRSANVTVESFVLHSAHPGVCEVWTLQISQILASQRNFLNEYQRNHVGTVSGCVVGVGVQGGGISGVSPGVGGGISQTSSIASGPQSVSRRPSKIPQPSHLPQPLRPHTGADADGHSKMLGGSPQGKHPSQTVEDKAQTQTPTNTVTPIPRVTVGPLPSTPTSKPRPGPLSPVAPTLATPAFGKDPLPPPPPSPGQKTGSGFRSSMPASPASRPGSFTFPVWPLWKRGKEIKPGKIEEVALVK